MDKQLFLRAIQQIEAGITVLKQLFQEEFKSAGKQAKPVSPQRESKLAIAESLPQQELGPVPDWSVAEWPEAIPEHLIVSEHAAEPEKRFRAIQILSMLDQNLAGLRCLDIGCGAGHIAVEMATKAHSVVAYDIVRNPGWDKFKDSSVYFTTSKDNGFGEPFDFILCYDVLDHLQRENPVDFLTWAASCLSPQGTMLLRVHPWTSRHGSHSYEVVNKAYIHLVLTPAELAERNIPVDTTLRLVRPHASYETIIRQAGLGIASRQVTTYDLEPFFDGEIIDRINKINWRGNITPEVLKKILTTQFIDYTLRLEHAD